MRIVIAILMIMLFSSCGAKRLAQSQVKTITKEVKIIERDTIIETKADSSYYRAWVRCVNNKPVFDEITKSKNKGALKAPKIVFKDSLLQVDCNLEAQDLLVEWKEKYIKEHEVTKDTIYIEIPAELTWWQKLWLRLGQIFVGIIGTVIIYVVWQLKRFF